MGACAVLEEVGDLAVHHIGGGRNEELHSRVRQFSYVGQARVLGGE